jgi:acetylornithine deacetylase
MAHAYQQKGRLVMNTDAILSRIDEKMCLRELAEMVQMKSYTETPGERALAERMCEKMVALGIDAELLPVEGDRVEAIGRWKGCGGGSSLLFNGHLDTNPVTEGWTVDPWGGVIDEEFIYGIGVSNMKAGDAAYWCAVKTLVEAGVKLKGDVVLTFVVGELQGGIGTVRAIEQGVTADYFINCEPTDLDALILHAGALMFRIELEGETRHLSKREQAIDALAAAAALVPRINDMTFSGAANPLHESVNRAHIGSLRAGLSKEFHEWRPPQIADCAQLLGTARYSPSQSRDSVLVDIQQMLDALVAQYPGLKAKVIFEDEQPNRPSMPPFEVSPDSRIVKTVNAAYQKIRGKPQPTGAIRPPAFYGTDAAHFARPRDGRSGIEGVVCGPGGEFNTMPDERVRIRDFIDCVKLYMLAILDICERE